MMFRTHLVFGIFAGLLVSKIFSISEFGLFMAICIVSSILPDLDTPFSKTGRKIPVLSWLLNFLFGHRGLMHTVFFPLLVYFILMLFGKNLWAGAFFVGYMSHLFIDMLNTKGVYFFFPIVRIRINGFIKIGGVLEKLLFVAILVGCLLLIVFK